MICLNARKSDNMVKLSNAEATARKMVGDDKLPNKYWVCWNNSFLEETEPGTFEWPEKQPFPGKGSCAGPFSTFREAKEYYDNISLDDEPCADCTTNKTIEDRLSGELCNAVVHKIMRPRYTYDDRCDTIFTRKEMERRGAKFE